MLPLLVVLLQSVLPCGSSSPYDEAWSVSSAGGASVLCPEPARSAAQVERIYQLTRNGEVAWRRSLPGRPALGAVSARGWSAVALRPVGVRQQLVVVDPQGAVALEHELRLTQFTPGPPLCFGPWENPIEQVLVSDMAGIVLVRRDDGLCQRFALQDGRELHALSLTERLLPNPPGRALLDAAAIEGEPLFVVHVATVERGALRSTYVVRGDDLFRRAQVVVDRGSTDASERLEELRDGFERSIETVRAEGGTRFSVHEPAGWVTYRVEREDDWNHEIVREGPAAAGDER
jgi:hypothetical protein